MNPKIPTRRDVLRGAMRLVVLAPAVGVFACKSGPDCSDVSGLAAGDAKARSDANYLNKAVDETKACEKCALFKAAPNAESCASCTVIKGPIAAKGTCTLFVPKPAT